MANSKVNKSQAVRDALDKNPTADSKQIVTLLARDGIKVSPTLVYYVKSKRKQAKRKAKRDRVAMASEGTASRNPIEMIKRVKELSRDVGGIRNLKLLVDLLAE